MDLNKVTNKYEQRLLTLYSALIWLLVLVLGFSSRESDRILPWTGPKAEIWSGLDGGKNLLFGMHNCPEGYAMRGALLGKDLFLCRRVPEYASDCFVDYGTTRGGIHACPDGTYVRGFNGEKKLLTCCYPQERGYMEFSGEERKDSMLRQDIQGHATLHICGRLEDEEYLTGMNNGATIFLCRNAVSPSLRMSDLPKLNLNPEKPRSYMLLRHSTDLVTWQRATRNWLARIMNLPLNKSYMTPPRYSVLLQDAVGEDGIKRQLIEYPSPVDGRMRRAYLLLPKNYPERGKSYPAVLVTHGHGTSKAGPAGKVVDTNHQAALFLAKRGAITLAPDTRSFGEYSMGMTHSSYTDSLDSLGEFPKWYLLDNLSNISLLSSLAGVDKQKIYAAGLSLGAYQALWVGAMDSRVKKVVVAGLYLGLRCLNSSRLHHQCQTVPALSRDYEIPEGEGQKRELNQWMISQDSLLIDIQDFAALIAPRPLLATWGDKDVFFTEWPNSECAQFAEKETKKLYALIGKRRNFRVAKIPKLGHEFAETVTAEFLGIRD